MKVRKAILCVLACGYLILWVGGVGSHLLFGRTPDNATWAAPAFLLLAGLLVLVPAERADCVKLLAVGALGFVAEALGVHSGFPFGRYEYTNVLQPQMIGVPLVMAAAWIVLAAYVKAMLTGFRLPAWLAALSAGLWMTALDLVIDPLAAGRLNYWRWIDTGAYYGIPARNFIGWFAVSWLIFSILKLIAGKSGRPKRWAPSIGLSILLFFTFIALAHHLLLVAGIGFGLWLVHLAIAQRQQVAVRRRSSGSIQLPGLSD
jgi:putative membrane protein